MILIFSQSKYEATTDEVINWISHYNFNFIRFNGIDFYKELEIYSEKCDGKFKILFNNFNLEDISAIWLRRWIYGKQRSDVLLYEGDNSSIRKINRFIGNEYNVLIDYLFSYLSPEKLFSSINREEINKLIVLEKASSLGLIIPETIITNDANRIKNKFGNNKLISKPLSVTPFFEDKDDEYIGYTTKVNLNNAEFSHSFFQVEIEKEYEIRSFYLDGNFYSMAIFSQEDVQTQLDFRIYNDLHPNRTVPYKLPKNIEKKLTKLVKYFNLNACSIDLIKSYNDEYVFLEVNPNGQFEMISSPCNYYLEKKVAESLIKIAKQNDTETK